GLEQIHGGVDEHFYPDRGVLTLPEFTQRFDPLTEAFGLAGDLVDPFPRAPKGNFELLQRVSQHGHEVPPLVRLCHTLSLLSCSAVGRTTFCAMWASSSPTDGLCCSSTLSMRHASPPSPPPRRCTGVGASLGASCSVDTRDRQGDAPPKVSAKQRRAM